MVVRLISPGGLQGDSRPCFYWARRYLTPLLGTCWRSTPPSSATEVRSEVTSCHVRMHISLLGH